MTATRQPSALFDFDGVVVDTESQYSRFWHRMGVDHLGISDLDSRVKGQTLEQIYRTFFPGREQLQGEITALLDRFEEQMSFHYIPGVLEFIRDVRSQGIPTAVVTSSNAKKMEAVYRAHPELPALFDRILTSELFARSKPAPDCFRLGMQLFGSAPADTLVFEDSLNGLRAGMASGARVVGLATTHPRRVIAPLCHLVVDDFRPWTFHSLTTALG
jgi:HAD superfamily hydrolase (TIGR01509 family)